MSNTPHEQEDIVSCYCPRNIFGENRRIILATIEQFLVAFMARLKKKDGQALVEYALILALIAIVVIVALNFLGGAVNNTLHNVGQNITNS